MIQPCHQLRYDVLKASRVVGGVLLSVVFYEVFYSTQRRHMPIVLLFLQIQALQGTELI